MKRPSVRACPVCGGAQLEALHHQAFVLPADYALPPGYDVAACVGCGAVYADTTATQADYDRYYGAFSRYEDPTVATGGGDGEEDRRRLGDVAAWLADHVPADAAVLDVGCGNGGLLDALRQRGFTRLAGMDVAEGCVRAIATKGYAGWVGGLPRPPALGERFDLVILSHVLEHLVDVRGAMAATDELLRPGGLLYVETPDAARYCGRNFPPFYFFDIEHINHWSVETLTALAAAAGYEIATAGEKDFVLPGIRLYPAAFALMRRAAPRAVPCGGATKAAVQAYVEESGRRIIPGLAELMARGRPLALWGAGSLAQRLLAHPALAGIGLRAVVDNDQNKQGNRVAGCTVMAPQEGLTGLPRDTVVIIAAAMLAPAITAEMRAMGYDFEVWIPEGQAAV